MDVELTHGNSWYRGLFRMIHVRLFPKHSARYFCINQLGRSNILAFLLIIVFYLENKWDGKERKRWESLSRGRNSDIENIVLEELYAEQDSWEDVLENYEDEIKTELIAELWNEQLDESLLTAINV